MAELLCDNGAEVTIKSTLGMTPLEIACKQGSFFAFQTISRYDQDRSPHLIALILPQNSTALLDPSKYCDFIVELMRQGIKANNLPPETREEILALCNTQTTHQYSLIRALLSFEMSDFLHNLAHNYSDYGSAYALEFMYAQGLFEHAAAIEHSMMQSPITLFDSYCKILQSSISRDDREVCTIMLAKLPRAEHIKNHSFLLNLAIKLKRKEIASMLLQHVLQNHALESTLKNAVSSRYSAAIEALLHAGAPTTAAEEFLNDKERENDAKIHKAFYAALKSRFTMHREILRNPTKDLYLSLLFGDIREFILGPMVKTHYPQPLSPSHSL